MVVPLSGNQQSGFARGSGLPWRAATHNDIPFIVNLLREFYATRESLFEIPFDPRSTAHSVAQIIDEGVCIVGPTSCAGATLHPFIVNAAAKVAFIQFWYFQRRQEIYILDALMGVLTAIGATHITAAAHAPDFTIGRRYVSRGLSPKELQYMGRLQ